MKRDDLPEGIEPFDPDRCQWCGDTGFDLRGLAQHVWHGCDVVNRLAEENMNDVRAWHRRAYDERQAALRTTDQGRQAI